MNVQFLNVNTVTPEELSVWESWLTAEKRQRIDRLPEKNRLLSLCGDGLARRMLGEALDLPPEDVVITERENGKPLTEGMFFSISHSGDVVGCAVSGREVGLDIERIRPVPARLGRGLEGWQTPEEFWRLWTCREAAIKHCGETLGRWRRGTLDGFVFSFPAAPEGYVAAICEKK